jgi:hypothetical protein
MDGFLGTRAPLMVDVVACALFVLLPAMGLGIWLARYGGRYSLHKWLQLGLAVVLLLAVAAFEADIRLHGWEERASSSPYYPRGVKASLWIHLPFAISTLVLWAVVIVRALRHFPSPPQPNHHSASHIFWARLAALDMALTAVTGWVFYWLAFVAA